ncbi:MAG: ABC transporter ATP-binding protein [Mycoplasmatales bacterium]
MLELKDVSFKYSERDSINILKDINLKFEKGKHYVIVGPSGSGKSTLLNVLCGIRLATSGSVLFNGEELTKISHQIKMTFQKNSLFPWKTIRQNLEIALDGNQGSNYNQTEYEELITTILAQTKISEYIDVYPKDLSGGQVQRANISRSLITKPKIMLLDEPTSSLDYLAKDNIQQLLIEVFTKNQEMTTIVVTHDISEALILGEEIIIVEQGEIKKIIASSFYGSNKEHHGADFWAKVNELMQELIWSY